MPTHSIKPGRSRTNVPDLAEEIKRLAFVRGPLAKMPTKRELGEMLGASSATVHGALKQLEDAKVLDMRQGSGIYVSPKIYRKTIAVICNSSLMMSEGASPFWGILLGQFAKHAVSRGQELDQDFEFFMTPPTAEPHAVLPDHLMKAVQAGAIDGAVAISLSFDSTQWLLDHEVPCVAFAGQAKWSVVINSEHFIQAGLQVLAEQGCRHIEYWGLPRHDDDNPAWYERTRRDAEVAYNTLGLNPPRTLVGPSEDLLADARLTSDQQVSTHRAYVAVKALIMDSKRPRPDGIFIGDDTMTNGALVGLLELGVLVGKDIKIASHANRNSPILYGVKQCLTLLEYDSAEIADALIRLLDQAMADPDLPETEISVPWRVRLTG